MAEHAATATDHAHGQMDIHQQQASFHVFVLMTKWGSLAIATVVLFSTLWFCTDAGFMGAAVSALILLILGIFFLREKPGSGH
jgi:hypothetical protein